MKKLALLAGLALALVGTVQTHKANAQDLTCKYPWDLNSVGEYCHTTAAVLRSSVWNPVDDIPENLNPHRDNWAVNRAIGYLIAVQVSDVSISRAISNISSSSNFIQYVKLHEEAIMSYAVCTAQFYSIWFGDEETLERFKAYLDKPGPNPACVGYLAEISSDL